MNTLSGGTRPADEAVREQDADHRDGDDDGGDRVDLGGEPLPEPAPDQQRQRILSPLEEKGDDYLVERDGEGEDGAGEDGRANQGKGDAPERPPGGRAEIGRGFVRLGPRR